MNIFNPPASLESSLLRSAEAARSATDLVRVLIVHNRYLQAGGEDVAFEQEVGLLRERGHEVRGVEQANAAIGPGGLAPKAALFAGTVWSRPAYRSMRRFIRAFRPGVVHVHNFLPLLSPSVYYAAWAEGVAVVQTLHNYRLICPGATLYRDGRVCEECVGGATWRGVVHACYRSSRLASFAVASMLEAHRALRTWRRVEAYVAVSEAVRGQVVAGGLPPGRVHVKPNFVDDDGPRREGPGEYALYVGRLAPEKGLRTLVEAWSERSGRPTPSLPLKIVGSGPLEGELRRLAAAAPRVELLGQRPRDEVMRLLANARCLICPSEWQEPLPFVALEALAAGVPILASRIGGFLELVEPGESGWHFSPRDPDDLARAATRLAEAPAESVRMGAAARRAYLARYTPERNYQQLIRIYAAARERRRS